MQFVSHTTEERPRLVKVTRGFAGRPGGIPTSAKAEDVIALNDAGADELIRAGIAVDFYQRRRRIKTVR